MLDGITVLDFASVGPAARASRILADYGARVIKLGAVPRPSGEERGTRPSGEERGTRPSGEERGTRAGGVQIIPPFYAYGGHRGMQRVLLDLKADAGRETFLRLAESADVVIESFRPGVVDRLGIGFDAVRAANPSIVYCSTSGYGQTGPASTWAGHDVNYLGVGGYLDVSERAPGDKPPLPGATVADMAAGGMQAVMAVLAALVRRQRTGEGAFLDVSIADGVLALMALYVDEYLATGTVPGPGHYILTGRYACYDTYSCADDRWLAVGAIEPHFWANLCRALGCEHWIEHQLDDDVQDAVRADLAAAFATKPRDAWAAELAPADTCVAPVLSVPELVDDPQYVARGVVVEATHPTAGPFRQLGPLLAGTVPPDGPVALPDWSTTDTDEVLRSTGFGDDEIARLRADGAVA
jgi:alpha-methylacyl-CoA racemase